MRKPTQKKFKLKKKMRLRERVSNRVDRARTHTRTFSYTFRLGSRVCLCDLTTHRMPMCLSMRRKLLSCIHATHQNEPNASERDGTTRTRMTYHSHFHRNSNRWLCMMHFKTMCLFMHLILFICLCEEKKTPSISVCCFISQNKERKNTHCFGFDVVFFVVQKNVLFTFVEKKTK